MLSRLFNSTKKPTYLFIQQSLQLCKTIISKMNVTKNIGHFTRYFYQKYPMSKIGNKQINFV